MKKVIVRFNQISDLSEDYQNRVKSLNDFYQQLPYDNNFIEFETNDLDLVFSDLDTIDPDWIVVVSLGHCTQDRNLYDDAIRYCEGKSLHLMAHLMDIEGQYPHIHPQIFVINYKSWKVAGRPSWNYQSGPINFIGQDYKSSEKKFHDSYTPHNIRPLGHEKEYLLSDLQVGAQVISAFLSQGWTVDNVPEELRKKKWHLYPDQCWQEFHNFLKGGPYRGSNDAQKHYSTLIGHLSDQVQRQYYVLNTEPLTSVTVDQPITHYAGVASGIKLMCTMIKNGFDLSTAVTIFDFSEIALKFQKFLIQNWNGDFSCYQVLCKKFEESHPGNFPCLPYGPWEDTYQYILGQLTLDKENFQKEWKKYQNLNHRFETINLYDSNDRLKLIDILREQKGFSYLWVSNAFYMEYSMITVGKENLKEIRNSFLRDLKNSGAQGTLDSHDHWSQGLIRFDQ